MVTATITWTSDTVKQRKMSWICSLGLHGIIAAVLALCYSYHNQPTVETPVNVSLLAMQAAPKPQEIIKQEIKTPVVKPVEKTTVKQESKTLPTPAKTEAILPMPVRQDVQEVASLKPVQKITSESDGAGHNVAEVIPVISNPTVRNQVSPIYPARAKELGMEGTALLHAMVLPSGQTAELKVVQSSGYQLLDDAAVAAVQQWQFEPYSPTQRAWVSVPVEFVIRN